MKHSNATSRVHRGLPWPSPALRIALIYAIVSGIWILTSDAAVLLFAPDEHTEELASLIKGWAFVAVTAVMLWALVRRMLIHIRKSETELRESEEQARAIYDGVNDAIFIHDGQTGAILDVNLTACRMFGYDREEFHNLRVEDISSGIEPYTQQHAMKIIARAITNLEATAEWCGKRRDGSLFWVEVSARPALIGGQTRMIVAARDISKRKQATEKVRILSRTVEQSPVSIVITNPAGAIEYVNPATCRLTGYTAEELIGKNPRVLKSDQTPEEEYHQLWTTILDGREWRGEFRNRKKNGEFYWETASISPITDDDGKISHFLAVKEDITDRKKVEEKLMRQEALLQEAGEIAHVGGWEFVTASSTGSWSAEVARIHDLDPSVEPNPAMGLDFYPGEWRKKIEAALEAAVSDGTPYDLELEFISATGREKWVRTIGHPIMENGRVVRVRGSLQDITERKHAEQELQASRERLRALLGRLQETREEERKRIAREIHDDLGQLLTGMKMDLSWLERRVPGIADEELRAALKVKLSETNKLTDRMLDSVQKIAHDLRPSLLDNLGLPSAIQSELRQFSDRTGIECEIRNLPSSIDLPPDDMTHVFRIFQEILTNIARHAGASKVTVLFAKTPEGVTLTLQDNGCGISTDARQAPLSLGLLGMSERAALLGGDIEIHSIPGGGTSVTLTVPSASVCLTEWQR